MDNNSFYAALAVLMLLVPFVADIAAGGDVWQISQQNEVSHRWGARLRGLVLGLPCITLVIPQLVIAAGSSFWAANYAIAVIALKMIVLWVVLLAEFWIAFDLRINKRWGKAWDYIGGTATLDTISGRLLSKFKKPGVAYFAAKLIIFAALLLTFILLLQSAL